MQQIVASGLAAQTCQFDRPCTNLAWCSFPGEPLSQRVHPNSPPQEFTRQQPKIFDRPRSQDNTPGWQFSHNLTPAKENMEKQWWKQAPPLRYVSQRPIDRSGNRSGILFIIITGEQLLKLPLPPPPRRCDTISQRPD